MGTMTRSLSYIEPARARAAGLVGPDDSKAGEYMKNFVKLIPAEAMTAYTTLSALAGGMTSGKGATLAVVGWACLIATFFIRLLTSHDPKESSGRVQWLTAVGAALAFFLYVYAQGGDMGTRFGFAAPEPGATDNLKIIASIAIAFWAGFAPALLPKFLKD